MLEPDRHRAPGRLYFAEIQSQGFGYEAVDNAPERIRNVTREAMLEVAKKVFRRDNAVIVKMLPEE